MSDCYCRLGLMCQPCYTKRGETIAQLRADLARVTAERDAFDLERRDMGDKRAFHIRAYDLELARHAETRKALEALGSDYGSLLKESNAYETALASTRAELARSEARVKELLRQKEASWKGYGSSG